MGKENVDVETVAYGPGIGMLKAEFLVGNRVADATAAGIRIVACDSIRGDQEGRQSARANRGARRLGRQRPRRGQPAGQETLPLAL